MSDHNQEAERAAPELLPCPFCGGAAELLLDSDGGPFAACPSCHVEQATYLPGFEHMAIAAWNRRHPAVGEDGLPPLPAPGITAYGIVGKDGAYTAEQYRQGQRDAFEAGKNWADVTFRAVRACSAEQYRKLEDERDQLREEIEDLRAQLARKSQEDAS
jgi:hypothetical protein